MATGQQIAADPHKRPRMRGYFFAEVALEYSAFGRPNAQLMHKPHGIDPSEKQVTPSSIHLIQRHGPETEYVI